MHFITEENFEELLKMRERNSLNLSGDLFCSKMHCLEVNMVDYLLIKPLLPQAPSVSQAAFFTVEYAHLHSRQPTQIPRSPWLVVHVLSHPRFSSYNFELIHRFQEHSNARKNYMDMSGMTDFLPISFSKTNTRNSIFFSLPNIFSDQILAAQHFRG